MGEVYRAKDSRLDRIVAVKILPPHFADDSTRRQRFEREAKVVSSLNHPNICTLHDIGHQDGVDFIVMEYLDGESLAERLENGPIPTPQVLQYGTQIASALDRAHRNGVTHRDLKPGNIILTKSGAKLLDFGLAKAEPSASLGKTMTDATPRPLPMTKLGTVIGTVPYMSPEQLDGKDADARSDIFSLGAVLYEMVTGNRAFQGQSEFSVASAILHKDPRRSARCSPSPRQLWNAPSGFVWQKIRTNVGSQQAISGTSCAGSRRAARSRERRSHCRLVLRPESGRRLPCGELSAPESPGSQRRCSPSSRRSRCSWHHVPGANTNPWPSAS